MTESRVPRERFGWEGLFGTCSGPAAGLFEVPGDRSEATGDRREMAGTAVEREPKAAGEAASGGCGGNRSRAWRSPAVGEGGSDGLAPFVILAGYGETGGCGAAGAGRAGDYCASQVEQ